MNIEQPKPLRIGIVGAGFSGTALSAAFHRLRQQQPSPSPIEIILFEKTGRFGAGDAYGTPYHFHLLNVRAQDMSAFEDAPSHFVDWLQTHSQALALLNPSMPVTEQFVPRVLYHQYLQDLLANMQDDTKTKLTLISAEVIDALATNQQVTLTLSDQRTIIVDKLILALGNSAPSAFPFPVAPTMNCIVNSWDYTALRHIATHDPVLIIGTGLSMIDAVLTLHHQQHQGKIHAVSRHGLLPLPHAENREPVLALSDTVPHQLLPLTKWLRGKINDHTQAGGDWRSIINAVRRHIPDVWEKASVSTKKRFLRHVLSYWNVHRHRIHTGIAALLEKLKVSQQLTIMSGRIVSVEAHHANVKLRHAHNITQIETAWVINCMGPPLSMTSGQQLLVQSLLKRGIVTLDPLSIGIAVSAAGELQQANGVHSANCYALGPPTKGRSWESSAVPEIRKQCFDLARHLFLNKS